MDPLTPSMEMSAMQVRRDEIEQRLAAGEHARAKRLLAGFWRSSPQASTARYVLARHEQLKERFPVERRRIAILRSFTLEPLEAMLRAEALVEAQLELQVRFGEFNAYMQEALDPNSWLGEACPEAIILAVQTRDIAPELWHGYASLSADEELATSQRVASELEMVIDALRERLDAAIVVHGLEAPPMPAWGRWTQTLSAARPARCARSIGGCRRRRGSARESTSSTTTA